MNDTFDIPSELVKKIKQDNVVLFVGAGLSMNAGLPSWKDLIIDILYKLKEKDSKLEGYIKTLQDGLLEPIEVLRKIESHKRDVIEIFEKEIRKYDEKTPTQLHSLVGQISSRIITTNYDCLLEMSHPRFEKILYSNNYKLSKMSNYSNYIFKIHGDIGEPDKCILFPSQYEELYSNNEKCPIFELKKIFSDKSILFIGFGLDDPYINFILEYVDELYSGFSPNHYIITTDKSKKWGNKIQPIIIDIYEDLEPLINKLILKKEDPEKLVKESIEIDIKEEQIIDVSFELEYDTPPDVRYWVGRKKEIENISNENFKVICITGIGGQGKSSLAAHYLKNKFDSSLYEFADWRDFKEETNRLQTKLISIIKRLSKGSFEVKNIDELTNKNLVDLLFSYLDKRKIIFVFDNIDSYIDLELFTPSGDVGYLFTEALNRNHNSKFIFTCRPFIKEASVNFYQISLAGLTIEETVELFKYYNISAKESAILELSQKAHQITKGHPLWLNIIAAQAVRGIEIGNAFLENIENKSSFDEDNISAILSQKIMNQIWNSLNPKQQNLLRGIAETVKSETIENLKKILESELNNNQFNKSFRTLKNLNLLEVKRSSISQDLVELHPLVKEFILSKYQRNERAKYITLLVKYYDSFIYILKPKLSSELSFNDFSNWTSKIELQINKGDYKVALIALQEVSPSLLAAGYVEEYIRVSEKLFDSINWEAAISNEEAYFHTQFQELILRLIQFGNFQKANGLLDKYEKLIPGKSSFYLTFCSLKCYMYWFQEQFEDAIVFGEKGEFLLSSSGLSDDFSLRHNLALARRDSKEEEKINQALIYFLQNETIESIIQSSSSEIEYSGHFYGNIGRCLEFLGEKEKSLICYYKSLSVLLKNRDGDSSLNISYACSWISNILIKAGGIQDGLYFLKYAITSSLSVSPPRAKILKDTWDYINCDVETKSQIEGKFDWQIEDYCKKQLNAFFNK